jgi:hypothetical protein
MEFYKVDEKTRVAALTFLEAAEIFKAESTETPCNLPETHYKQVQAALSAFEKDFLRATSQLTKFVALSKAIAETLEANGAEEGVKKKSFWSKFKGQSNMEKEVINLVKESRLPFNAQKIAEEFAMLDMEDRQQFINAAKLTKVEPILHDIESSFSQSKPASWFSKLGDRLTSGLDKVFPGGFHKPVPDSVRV